MDTGQIIHNTRYCNGREDEDEIILTALDTYLPVLHIAEGHFEYVFGRPVFYEVPWHGFTRDYCEFKGVFDSGDDQIITDLKEYIDDLLYYKDVEFDYEETRGAYELILKWFIAAKELGCKKVLVRLD